MVDIGYLVPRVITVWKSMPYPSESPEAQDL